MQVYELFVDSKDIYTEDGYSLLFHNPYEIGMATEAAVKNGFTDIRIRQADVMDKCEYIKRLQEQHPEIPID